VAAAAPDSPPLVLGDMGLEKDWPVDQDNFVKDSERILP
jgi:hypothetical protein